MSQSKQIREYRDLAVAAYEKAVPGSAEDQKAFVEWSKQSFHEIQLAENAAEAWQAYNRTPEKATLIVCMAVEKWFSFLTIPELEETVQFSPEGHILRTKAEDRKSEIISKAMGSERVRKIMEEMEGNDM